MQCIFDISCVDFFNGLYFLLSLVVFEKISFSEKATKIWSYNSLDLTLLSKCQAGDNFKFLWPSQKS